MKTILRNSVKLAVVVVTLFTTVTSNAQEKITSPSTTGSENYDQGFRLGFGVNAGIPTQEPFDYNLGADVRLQYDLSSRYSVTFTTGFSNFFAKGDNNDLGYVPVKGGFKAFVLKDKLYLLGEVGLAISVTNDYNENSLILSPGIGYATKYVDFSVRYEHYNDFPALDSNGDAKKGLGQVALRLAYGFKI